MEKDIECKKCGTINCVHVEEKNGHRVAYCDNCGAYVKHLAFTVPKFYFGKYKGQLVKDVFDLEYLVWFRTNTKPSPAMRSAVTEQIAIIDERRQRVDQTFERE